MTRIAALALLVGCGSSGSGKSPPKDLQTVASQPAQGTVMGKAFAIGSRTMDVDNRSNELDVTLIPNAVADCAFTQSPGFPQVLFFVPPNVGTYKLSLDTHTVTFVDMPSDNLIVTEGVIQIDSISATAVSGGLHAWDAEFGEINGRFDGPICTIAGG
jgi:hypothetical protein